MFVGISLLGNFEITCSSLLYDSDDFDLDTNRKLFDCVHMFIDSSGRLYLNIMESRLCLLA